MLLRKLSAGAEEPLSDFHRSWENLRDQTGAFNQRGLEYALDEMVRNGHQECLFIKIAVNQLSKYNEKLGHDQTDELLHNLRGWLETHHSANTNFKLYRAGADWVMLFEKGADQKTALEIQKSIQELKHIQDNELNLATIAVNTELKPNTLHSVYTMIDHLKPAKGAEFQENVFQAHINSSGSVSFAQNIYKINNLTESAQGARIQSEYLEAFRECEQLLEQGLTYQQIENKIMKDINDILPQECSTIKNINILDYNTNYRIIGTRKAFLDPNTIIIPLLNAYNKPVGALRIELNKPFPGWDHGKKLRDTIEGKTLYRFERRDNARKEASLDQANNAKNNQEKQTLNNLEKYFQSDIFLNTYYLLVDLRRYSPVTSLLDQTGRSPFFSLAIVPYLQDVVSQKKKYADLPEYKIIEHLLEKDGFIIIKQGGEEFFIYFAPDKNSSEEAMAFDYNKFSRHSTSWGEQAGDVYMERTSGLLRHYLSQEINNYRQQNTTFNQEIYIKAFNAALEKVNAREISFKITELDTPIVNKEGKQIFFAVNAQGNVVLFAAANAAELNDSIMRSEEILPTLPLFSENNRLTRRKLLFLNNINMAGAETLTVDLNKLKSVNPKGVYTLDGNNIKGIADQQLLWGLSLAGSIIAFIRTVRQTIKKTNQLAEEEKEAINLKKVEKNIQGSGIRRG